MEFAWKNRTLAVIELDLNEEKLFRLPPISNISNEVENGTAVSRIIVNIFHTEMPDPNPVALQRARPRRGGTTWHRSDGIVIVIDDNNNPLGGDNGPARDLKIELRHSDHLSVPAHGSPYPNTVIATSKWHDDLWRLWIRRGADPISPSTNPRKYRIEVDYMSQLPIIERRIPIIFFKNGFDLNWNQQQYAQIRLQGPNIILGFREDLAELYHVPEFKYELKDYLDFNDIRVERLTLNIQIKPLTNEFGQVEMCPAIQTRMQLKGGTVYVKKTLVEHIPISIPDLDIQIIRFYLVCRAGSIEVRPVIDLSRLYEALDQVGLDFISDKIKNYVDEKSKEFGKKLDIIGGFLRPWLAGGNYEIRSIGYAPAPGEIPEVDGSFNDPKGDLIVKYIGPREAEPSGINRDPDSNHQVNDDSIPLFDIPFEEHIRISEPPIGYEPIVPNNIGNLAKINHIVILMQENRSFDQVLGYLSRERIREYFSLFPYPNEEEEEINLIDERVIGLAPADHSDYSKQVNFYKFPENLYYPLKTDEDRLGEAPLPRPNNSLTAWPSYSLDNPAHGANEVNVQISAKSDNEMGGFVRSYAARLGENTPSVYLRLVMDYYNDTHLKNSAGLSVYDNLAKQFGICDLWFTSFAGGTIPNRFVSLTGSLNTDRLGNIEEFNPSIETMSPSELPTLFEYLTKYKRSWKVFEHGYSLTRYFGKHTFDMTNIIQFGDPDQGFEATARDGKLPDVTLIEPDYIELPPGNDDHAPADMKDGQDLIYKIVKALIASPQWANTLLIITYDEHGGFYDHVTPPENNDRIGVVGSRITLGPRVPTFVISPLIKPGRAFHKRFDHTTIGATIMRRFCAKGQNQLPPSVSDRLDKANDLRDILELDTPRTNFGPFSDFQALNLQRRTSIETGNSVIKTNDKMDDFHWMLELTRLITGQPSRGTAS